MTSSWNFSKFYGLRGDEASILRSIQEVEGKFPLPEEAIGRLGRITISLKP